MTEPRFFPPEATPTMTMMTESSIEDLNVAHFRRVVERGDAESAVRLYQRMSEKAGYWKRLAQLNGVCLEAVEAALKRWMETRR